jgi:3-deoxy-D-manno-octulosonic-acid transferase
LPIIWLVSYFNDKLGQNLAGQKDIWRALNRFNHLVHNDPKPVIWVHAASAGEFEQVRPVLSRLKSKDVYVFQTLTSSTIYYKVSQSSEFDGVCFLPWDIYPRVNKFVKSLNPSLFINTRHDLWPNLLLILKRNGVRSVLINANLYGNSARLKPILRSVNRTIFKNIDHLYTGSKELQVHLKQLFDGPIDVIGDTRFDQVKERSERNSLQFLDESKINDRRVIIYGSTVDSDLSIVCKGISASLNDQNSLHVIVPHEVGEKNLIPWEVELYRSKIKSIRHSELEEYSEESVIIWNSVGELADLYKYADLAYIGAGFTTGVHSVTEAAIYHVPAAHGPVYDILAEAIELVELNFSTVVLDHQELTAFLAMSDDDISALNTQIASFIDQRLGATDKFLAKEFSRSAFIKTD